MKTCPKCGAQMQDDSRFCMACGTPFAQSSSSQSQAGTYAYPGQTMGYAPYDHTHEFSAKDISENKVIAMLCYLMGTVGIILALLGSNHSPYAAFHVRQALKFVVVNILTGLVALVFCWTILVPIACGIFYLILTVVRIICFFSICNGNAKEPPIIRSFGFLR